MAGERMGVVCGRGLAGGGGAFRGVREQACMAGWVCVRPGVVWGGGRVRGATF